MARIRNHLLVLLLAIKINSNIGLMWERLHCSSDAEQDVPEGTVKDIGRFPWLGIVQHSFYVAGGTHFAVTGAVLIHPAFAIAPAEDIAQINPDQLVNNTKLIVWNGNGEKFALDVKDYILHPEFTNKVTTATIALLDLIKWADDEMSDWKAPVLPICMPVKGSGLFENIYAVKMTDASGHMEKEVYKMKIVDDQDCSEFYYKAQLSYQKMNPVNPTCAVSEFATKPCVWDGGTALITRQSWGFWKLLGFAVRGPACGAPTKFLNIHDYLPWINDIISEIPYEDAKDVYKLGLRRVSPIKLIMYKADVKIPKGQGQCERRERGNVLYKDSSEFLLNKNFAQGFFFVVITQIAEFLCAEVQLAVASRTNAAVWVEHNCHQDVMGLAHGQYPRPDRRKALVEVTLYGREEKPRFIPDPFKSSVHTTGWWPTPDRLRFYYFTPVGLWWYSL